MTSSEVAILGESEEQKQQRKRQEAELQRLAERLGVSPLTDDEAGWQVIAFVLEDGTRYSWTALLHAHLDMMAA